MKFEKVDRSSWGREEYFEHYFSNNPCTYSMTVKLDITMIRERHIKLYPAMLYYLTTVVNAHPEFRMDFNKAGELGVYSEMTPYYTVFNRQSETFFNVWTEYKPNIEDFCAAYEADMQRYAGTKGMLGKPDVPDNYFNVSMVPWAAFEGFNLNIQSGYTYLKPIFTMGKYYQENGRTMMPLAVQAHHSVCDGFHVCRFINELQELINA